MEGVGVCVQSLLHQKFLYTDRLKKPNVKAAQHCCFIFALMGWTFQINASNSLGYFNTLIVLYFFFIDELVWLNSQQQSASAFGFTLKETTWWWLLTSCDHPPPPPSPIPPPQWLDSGFATSHFSVSLSLSLCTEAAAKSLQQSGRQA